MILLTVSSALANEVDSFQFLQKPVAVDGTKAQSRQDPRGQVAKGSTTGKQLCVVSPPKLPRMTSFANRT